MISYEKISIVKDYSKALEAQLPQLLGSRISIVILTHLCTTEFMFAAFEQEVSPMAVLLPIS